MPDANVQGDELICRGKAYHDHQRREEEERARAPKIESIIRALEQHQASVEGLAGRIQQAEGVLATLGRAVETGRQEAAESLAVMRSDLTKLTSTMAGLVDVQNTLLSQFTELAAALKAKPVEAPAIPAEAPPASSKEGPVTVPPANGNEPVGSSLKTADDSGQRRSGRGIWGVAAAVLMVGLVLVTGVYAWPIRH